MKAWRLMVWDVPEPLTALLSRFSFERTRKNPSNWYRVFDPAKDKDAAVKARQHLLDAGLKGSWSQVDRKPPRQTFNAAHKPQHSHSFGYTDFSKPNVSQGWRMKQRRK